MAEETTINNNTTLTELKVEQSDGQTFDVVRDDSTDESDDGGYEQVDQRASELKTETVMNSSISGRIDDESHRSNDRTASPQLLNDDELKMFEHLAQLDYETEKQERTSVNQSTNHHQLLGDSSSNLDEQPLIHSQISVSNIVESEEYTITTNYTITTTHPLSSVNINTSVISETSSLSTEDQEIHENKVEIPVEVSLSPRQLGKTIIPGLNALRGSTMLPNPPIDEHQEMEDDEYDDFQEVSLGNDGTPQKKGKKRHNTSDANESFDYECNVWCFAQPISYLFTHLFSNNDSNYSKENEVEMNVNNVNNNKQIEA